MFDMAMDDLDGDAENLEGHPLQWHCAVWLYICEAFISGKGKTHKHKQICGIVPGLGGVPKFCLCVFFSAHSLWGRKTHKQSPPPPKSRDNPVKILFTCFFFMCFFARFRASCTLLWDYLSDTPVSRDTAFWVSQWSSPPLSCEKGGFLGVSMWRDWARYLSRQRPHLRGDMPSARRVSRQYLQDTTWN